MKTNRNCNSIVLSNSPKPGVKEGRKEKEKGTLAQHLSTKFRAYSRARFYIEIR